MRLRVLSAVATAIALAGTGRAQVRPITVDDLMKLTSIVCVQISPDGHRVAYVVSTPNLTENEQQPALFVVSVGGGPPTRFGEDVRILNLPSPRPQLRWSPDGAMLSVRGLVSGRPRVEVLSCVEDHGEDGGIRDLSAGRACAA